MTTHTSAGRSRSGRGDTSSGWYGWVVFAAVMMMLLGAFHAMAGLVALFQEEYFLVTANGLVVTADYSTWGWVHLILGIVVAAAGGALLAGQTWARAVAVLAAMVSAVVNLAFLSAYPLWSAIMIAVDVMVIYAVTADRGSYESWQE
jgi:hypothetical protein